MPCPIQFHLDRFRDTLRAAHTRLSAQQIPDPADLVMEEQTRVVESLLWLLCAVEDVHAPKGRFGFLREVAEAFESAGLSRALGHAAWNLRANITADDGLIYTDTVRQAWLAVRTTHEFANVAHEERRAGAASAD
jgi:hypothetical protein